MMTPEQFRVMLDSIAWTHAGSARDVCEQEYRTLHAAYESQKREVERLTAELEEAKEPYPSYCPVCGSCGIPDCCGFRCINFADHYKEYTETKAERDALAKRVEELMAGVPPYRRSGSKTLEYELEHGCDDNGCRIKKPTGPGTNGGCMCSWIARQQHQEQTITQAVQLLERAADGIDCLLNGLLGGGHYTNIVKPIRDDIRAFLQRIGGK